MPTYSWIKFIDVHLLILYVVICIQTSRSKFVIQKDRVCVSCSRVLCTPTLDISLHDKSTWSFWIKNSNPDICMHTTTYNINDGTSANFIEEYVSIMLPRTSIFLYALTSPWGRWLIAAACRSHEYEWLVTLHKLCTFVACVGNYGHNAWNE